MPHLCFRLCRKASISAITHSGLSRMPANTNYHVNQPPKRQDGRACSQPRWLGETVVTTRGYPNASACAVGAREGGRGRTHVAGKGVAVVRCIWHPAGHLHTLQGWLSRSRYPDMIKVGAWVWGDSIACSTAQGTGTRSTHHPGACPLVLPSAALCTWACRQRARVPARQPAHAAQSAPHLLALIVGRRW